LTKKVDAKSDSIPRKGGIAASFLDGPTDLELNGFRQQNVISAPTVGIRLAIVA
jgi:hypothetical protein